MEGRKIEHFIAIVTLSTFILFSGSLNLFGQDYFHSNLNKALRIGKKADKYIFVRTDLSHSLVDFEQWEKEMFNEPELRSLLNKKFICVKAKLASINKFIKPKPKEYSRFSFPEYLILRPDKSVLLIKNFMPLDKKLLINDLISIPKIDSLNRSFEKKYKKSKNDLKYLLSFQQFLDSCGVQIKEEQISKRILRLSDNPNDVGVMKIRLKRLYNKKHYKYVIKNKNLFIDSLGHNFVYQALYSDFRGRNPGRYRPYDSHIPLNPIKTQFIELFGDDYFQKYYYDYILSIFYLRSPKNNKDEIEYFNALVFKLNNDNCEFIGKYLFEHYRQMILISNEKHRLIQLLEGLTSLLNNDSTHLDYYDLKAFVEYKLGHHERATLTIKEANLKSVEKNGIPFKSTINMLMQEDRDRKKSIN